jgi:hypothetical protein
MVKATDTVLQIPSGGTRSMVKATDTVLQIPSGGTRSMVKATDTTVDVPMIPKIRDRSWISCSYTRYLAVKNAVTGPSRAGNNHPSRPCKSRQTPT